jgi:chromosome segregation ATPase
MSRPTASIPHPSAPVRRGATVQSYGPHAKHRDEKTNEPLVVIPAPARAAGRRANTTQAQRADAAAATNTAAARSDDAASAAVSGGGAFAAFPALDRFLSEKGQNLRTRREQQLQIEAAEAAAVSRPRAPLYVDTLYAPAPYGFPPPQAAYPYAHPLPQAAFVPQAAVVHPLPVALPAAEVPAHDDPEPLSPASLEEVLLIPEVQAHLRELKRQWRKEVEHELRFQQPPRQHKRNNSEDGGEDVAAGEGERKSNHRVRFSDANTTTDSPNASAVDAAEVQYLRDQLLEEQQAHSATMSRLTQLTSARMEEQRAQDVEQQQRTQEMEEMRARLHAAELKANSAQQALEDERQRHQQQLSSFQSSDSLVSSLTSKYESLLERLTSEKLAAAEIAATQRIDHAQIERLQREVTELQQKLQDARAQISVADEKLLAAERSHRQAAHAWAQKEEQLLFSRQDTFGKIEAENERLRIQIQQLQTEARQHVDQTQQLHEKLADVQSRLQEQTRHVEERLQEEERGKQEQMRFTEQIQANLDLLSRESQSKQATVASVEAELRTVLQAMEGLKAKYSAKVSHLQQELEVRSSEVDDCKVLLKTIMAEEKQTRAQRNEAKQQLQRVEQQLQQSQATVARLQQENVQLQSRPHNDAATTRVHSLEHELRISHEIQARLEQEKEQLAVRLDDLEEQARNTARRSAEERNQHDQALAAASAPAQPDPHLLRSFHELSDKLAIKEKILESLEEQLAKETRTATQLDAEVRALNKSNSELERSVSEMDEARRSAQRELQELQVESQEWLRFECENEEMRKEVELIQQENAKLHKQLAKKQESLLYVDKELVEMKQLFEQKQSELVAKCDRQTAEVKQEVSRLRDELQHTRNQLHERTQQYQDAQNNAHRSEQELRVLILELDQQTRKQQQLKMRMQAMQQELL